MDTTCWWIQLRAISRSGLWWYKWKVKPNSLGQADARRTGRLRKIKASGDMRFARWCWKMGILWLQVAEESQLVLILIEPNISAMLWGVVALSVEGKIPVWTTSMGAHSGNAVGITFLDRQYLLMQLGEWKDRWILMAHRGSTECLMAVRCTEEGIQNFPDKQKLWLDILAIA